MRRLFLRELRRQVPVAAAPVVLAVLCYVLFLMTGVSGDGDVVAFGLALIAAPWLLGTAAVAPEVESGAVGYLATLPVPAGRLFAIRASAGALLSATSIGVAALAVGLLSGTGPSELLVLAGDRQASRELPVVIAVMTGVTFVGALAASSVVRSTLGAFVAGPLVALGAISAGLAVSDWAHQPEAAAVGTLIAVPVLLAGTALWANMRGDLHRPSWRPALVTLAVLGVGLLGIQGGVLAVDRIGTPVEVEVEHVGDGFAVLREQSTRRLSYHRGDPGEAWLVDGRTQSRHPFPEGAYLVSASPDGRRLLLQDGEGWLLWEPGVGVVDRSPVFYTVWTPRPKPVDVFGRYQRHRFVWSDGSPYQFDGVSLVNWRGGERLPTPEGAEICVGLGPRWLLWVDEAETWRAWDPAEDEVCELTLPGGAAPVDVLSVSRDCVLLAGAEVEGEPSRRELWLQRLPDGEPQRLDRDVLTSEGSNLRASGGAWLYGVIDDRYALLRQSWTDYHRDGANHDESCLIDLETGRTYDQSPMWIRDAEWLSLGAAGYLRYADLDDLEFVPARPGCASLGFSDRGPDGRSVGVEVGPEGELGTAALPGR